MSEDAKPAMDAETSNPAEVVKTEKLVDAKLDATPEAAAKVAGPEATDTVKAGQKEEANGAADAAMSKESSDAKSEEKATNGADKKGDEQKSSRYGRGKDTWRGKPFYRTKFQPGPSEFDNLPETDDPNEIRDQVEFYFSDANLRTDRHLFMKLGGHKNRPVLVKHLCEFKRMRRFQPYSAVVAALRDSKDLIVVDDGRYTGQGNEGVKRKVAFKVPGYYNDDYPDPMELFDFMQDPSENKLENSIYAKGFGDEDQAGQIALEQFFKPYGSVMVRKRRDKENNNKWKGSVFVEFDSEEAQQQFLALDPKPKYNGNELTVMGKLEYNEMKCAEKGITPGSVGGVEFKTHSQLRREKEERRQVRGRNHHRSDKYNKYGDRKDRGDKDRSDRRKYRDRRDRDRSRDRSRSRSRSPHRDRSVSRGSTDSDDWFERRKRFQDSKKYKSDKRDKREKRDKRDRRHSPEERRKSPERDAHGRPLIKDTRTDAERGNTKRKAEDFDREDSAKKSKLDIKTDS